MSTELEIAVRVAVASLAGLAVGVERERSGHASGPGARFAGARTFFLVGLMAGLTGWFASSGYTAVSVALIAGAAGLAIAAYVVAARGPGDSIDGTTEVAAMAVLGLGFAAGLGHLAIAGGGTAIVALALAEKSRIHAGIQRLDDEELRAAFQFGVLALVILPILPEGPYGPLGGIRPRELWVWVLLISGVSFAGYLARRSVGQSRGYRVAGLLGGLASSTLVTLSFSRRSRAEPALARPLAVGTVAASTIPFVRVVVVSLLVTPAVTRALLPYLVVPFLAGAVVLYVALRRPGPDPAGEERPQVMKSPLGLPSAIKLAVAFQIVLMVLAFVRDRFGANGILATAGLVGLTDVDPVTLSMSKLGAQPAFVEVAARAVAVGVLANTLFKLAVALVAGAPAYRRAAGLGLLLLAVASALGLLFPLHFAAAAFAR